MSREETKEWISAIRESAGSHRGMIDSIVEQLSDSELRTRPADGVNSVAIILRHLGGNLKGRWTDFLTTDGEKADRDRDSEFEDWEGDRQSLLDYFDCGWNAFSDAIACIDGVGIEKTVTIRGENHTIPQAFSRSVTHLSYHVGQMAIIARMVHKGEWRWLSIAPGDSNEFNARTWGTAASRSVFSDPGETGSR